MANSKISALTAATTPVAGTETLPIVQSGATKQVSIANLTAGRAVSASSFSANTTNVFAKVSVELTGGNAILTRYNSSNKPAGLYTGGTSGESFFGANLNWSSGNVFNYQITGLMWYLGDPGGSGTTVSLGLASGTAGNSAGVDTLSTAVAKWDTSGNYTMVNGNIVPATAAKGINFTANTPAAGKTSQLLNWYEEGTWTPALLFGGGSTGITYSVQEGLYTRVGRQVTLTGRIFLTNKGSSTGIVTVTGVPFSGGTNYPAQIVDASDGFLGLTVPLYFVIAGNTLYLSTQGATGRASVTNTSFTNTSDLRFSMTYFV